jgi:DNA primase
VAIPQHFIQELLSRADIVEVVGRYVQLKKTGANFSGLCPFHSEKSPSFTVSAPKQFYHCFGCGKHGNALEFLMEYTGAGFVDAVHDLAQQCGMQVPDDERTPAERQRAAQESEKRGTLIDVLTKAADAYKTHLRNAPHAVDYLKQRGLSGAIARDFGLGYAPDGWRSLASVFARYDDPLLAQSGLVIVNEEGDGRRYDRFRHRIMFPIRSIKGEVIGFGGRVLDDTKPKYLNSPETPVFHKGHELYGLFEARSALRERGYALVAEGYMDVVALAQLGFANAVATLGTACTPEHVQKLFRFTDQIVFSFDGDAAGRRAARKALQAALPMATDTRTIKFLFLPPEHDPDSFIRAEGAPAFEQAVQAALPLSRYLLETAAEGVDLGSAEGRSHLAANAKALWQLLPAGALAQQLLAEIAAQVQVGTHELAELWKLGRPPARSRGGGAFGPAQSDHGRSARHAPPPFPAPAFSGRATTATPPRTPPASRAQRALQIVLTEPSAWNRMSQDDHALLCDLPAPYGPLFVWIAGQWLDHGPQPWSALREALRGHPQQADAIGAVESIPREIEADPSELDYILSAERKSKLEQALRRAAEAGDTDAYRKLLAQLPKAKT